MFFVRIFIPFLAVLLGISQGAALFAQSVFFQNDWETLPVFHNGRVMPLHTFAQKTVWEICGTTQPYIVWDDTVIAELNQILEGMQTQTSAENEEAERFRFLNRKHDWVDGGFNRDYSVFEVDNQPPALPAVLPIQELGKTRLTHIADRIRQLLPPKGRYFTADEILLSWIGEPEVWAFIPIFPVPESDYLDEMFGITSQGDARRTTYFVSLYQLENSPRYKQRREDINRRKELGQQPDYPIPFDQITERLENQVRLFRELTYHPCRQMPDRMLAILRQAAGMSREPSPYVSAFEAWSYLLTLGEIPARQTTEPEVPAQELTQIHPTTQRWHNIADKLNLLLRVYRHSDSKGNAVFPNPLIIEEQFENLISLVDANLAESAVLMESIYPGVSFQYTHQYTPDSSGRNFPEAAKLLPRLLLPENEPNRQSVRQIIIGYHFSVKKLRALIESAYLALYDNGLSLRLLPICFPFVQDVPSIQETAGVQPWGTSQMIFGSGNVFIKRFFGLHAPLVSDSAAEIAAESDAAEPETTESETTESKISETNLPEATPLAEPPTDNQVPQTPTTEEELLFQPFSMENGILPLPQNETGGIFSVVRDNLQNILLSYATLGGAYGTADFTGKMQQLQYSIRQAAQNIEHNIEQDIESDKTPLDKSGELAKKTAYPQDNRKLSAEYRYDRISPFFWMGLFALLAVLFNAGAFLASATRSKSAAAQTVWIHSVNDEHSVQVQPENADEKFELLDYTNSFEDRLYITSVCMLLCSIFAAFLGGAMRSAVTGWAPITNMYETVVMMALSTAVLGFWYALHPLLHPALHLAWTLSQFPRIDAVLNGFVSRKPKNADVLPEDFATNQQAVNPEPRRDQMIAQRKLLGQCLTAIPRLILTAATFYGIVLLAYGESVIEAGFFAAAAEMFETADSIDLLTIIASVILLVWIIPHVFLTLCLMPALLLRPSWLADEKGILSYETTMSVFENEKSCKPPMSIPSAGLRHSELSGVFRGEHHAGRIFQSNSSGAAWLKQTRNALLKRKVFVGITAMIVFGAGLATYLNRGEFNPDIRPIAAVLRSNFWLTVHVTAIVVSYAAAFVAWGMATIALGYVIFGRYVRKPSDTAQNGQTGEQIVQLPSACRMFSPVIARLLRIALLLLIIGTILGARWADYSWGRFWSWDPKEVWALITILFYTIVFHGRIARYYDIVGIMVGALFASIAVIITWYGINFVFKGSVHSYGGGAESNATLFLGMFIAANLLWGTLALLRYCTEMFTPSATLTERKTNV